jgi:hypothetical protein
MIFFFMKTFHEDLTEFFNVIHFFSEEELLSSKIYFSCVVCFILLFS